MEISARAPPLLAGSIMMALVSCGARSGVRANFDGNA
jgi:hypothetical protein